METKQYLHKVCYGFSSLTVAFVIALIYWLYQGHQEHSTTPTFQNSDMDTFEIGPENSCLVEPWIGDGYCDDAANNAECDYDLDDCCQPESDRNSCTNCTCWVDNDQLVKIKEELCLEYNYNLGDGTCDLDLNSKEYFFDIGDCCQMDTICVENRFDQVTCPDHPCIESNQYCIEHELGDGICQDHNNGPYCDYDLGDCCSISSQAYEDCCTCKCSTFNLFDPYYHQLFHIP